MIYIYNGRQVGNVLTQLIGVSWGPTQLYIYIFTNFEISDAQRSYFMPSELNYV